jgi:SAM-dependent methyltransferase
MNLLQNRLGVFLYLMLRNDWSWGLLSDADRALVLKANQSHNTGREDYARPDLYGGERMAGGDNWDSSESRQSTERGRALTETLARHRPRRVLEIGPGAGFFTRMICEFDSVQEYWAVDINEAFLTYLKPRVASLKERKASLSAEFRVGDVVDVPLPDGHFDLIFLFSTVHHIPNRLPLFQRLGRALAPGGRILTFDPAHYAPRWLKLLRCMPEYLRPEYFGKPENLSTHHMCSKGEFRKIARRTGDLRIEKFFWKWPGKIERTPIPAFIRPALYPLSHEIGMLCQKT